MSVGGAGGSPGGSATLRGCPQVPSKSLMKPDRVRARPAGGQLPAAAIVQGHAAGQIGRNDAAGMTPVTHGADDDMVREPEMVQAYRDTWKLGVHSFPTYLRDRLDGPLLVEEQTTTVVGGPRDRLEVLASGDLFIRFDDT